MGRRGIFFKKTENRGPLINMFCLLLLKTETFKMEIESYPPFLYVDLYYLWFKFNINSFLCFFDGFNR